MLSRLLRGYRLPRVAEAKNLKTATSRGIAERKKQRLDIVQNLDSSTALFSTPTAVKNAPASSALPGRAGAKRKKWSQRSRIVKKPYIHTLH